MEMTPRERWLALLNRKSPDRIPTDYQATDEVTARLCRDLGCADDEALYRKLHIDARRKIEPTWNRPADRPPEADMWGIVYRSVSYGSGAISSRTSAAGQCPTASPRSTPIVGRRATSSTTRAITRAVERHDGYRPIHAGCYEPFLLYGYLRGLQTAMEDLALRPEIADAILGHIFDFYYEHHRRIFAAGRGRIDLTSSPRTWARRPAR